METSKVRLRCIESHPKLHLLTVICSSREIVELFFKPSLDAIVKAIEELKNDARAPLSASYELSNLLTRADDDTRLFFWSVASAPVTGCIPNWESP
jgi:hypothetical protein